MDPIYVTGHRNPDTDSIVAAMAYAALRNAVGDREYEAACLGRVSDETEMVLKKFGFHPPKRINNMYTQVQDLDYDTPPFLNTGVTVGRAWDILQEQKNISAVPVINEDGTLYGMLSAGDVASYDMNSVYNPVVKDVPIYNLLSVLEGMVLNSGGEMKDVVSGEIRVALPTGVENQEISKPNTILVCGNQPDVIQKGLEQGINCIIVCQTEVSQDILETETETCIISTPFDAYQVVRLVCHALPIARVGRNTARGTEMVSFHLDDYIDDVRNKVLESRFRSYPILDENEKVVGTLGRYHLLRPRRKKVILMDHNEKSQSVQGLDQATILEIIDHHRLADIQTKNPIYVRNEPVGSTATIVATMYQEKGLMPTPKMAGMLAAAIISDTVMFKSPTCTQRDIAMANRMARIASVSLDELGKAIFSATCGDDKTTLAMLNTDYKEFHIAGHDLAVSQITCMDSDRLLARKDEFLFEMDRIRQKQGLDSVVLMLTDVLLEGTYLIFVGDEDNIRSAFGIKESDENISFQPKLMSRKKQVIPTLSALWG